MEGCEAIDIGGVDICPAFQQSLDLVLVARCACRQKHDPGRKLDSRRPPR